MFTREWTTKEIEILRRVYPIGGRFAVSRQLKDRSPRACAHAAQKIGVRFEGDPYAIRKHTPRALTPEQIDLAQRARNRGILGTHIARYFGVAPKTIYKFTLPPP